MTPEELARAEEALQQLPADDPRRIEVLAIRAEARAKQIEDARREVHADASDADLETRLVELTDDSGEVNIARVEWEDARRLHPARTSLKAGQATEPDPRELKARKKFEEVRRESFAIEAELDARRALEHRERFLDGRISRDLETHGLHDDQTLKEKHDQLIQLELYDDAARLKEQMNKPYVSRPWARSVAEKALKLAEQELENTPPIRSVGTIPADAKAQQEFWEASKVVVEGQ